MTLYVDEITHEQELREVNGIELLIDKDELCSYAGILKFETIDLEFKWDSRAEMVFSDLGSYTAAELLAVIAKKAD